MQWLPKPRCGGTGQKVQKLPGEVKKEGNNGKKVRLFLLQCSMVMGSSCVKSSRGYRVREYLSTEFGINCNFSTTGQKYAGAYRYITKLDQQAVKCHVLMKHPNLDMINAASNCSKMLPINAELLLLLLLLRGNLQSKRRNKGSG